MKKTALFISFLLYGSHAAASVTAGDAAEQYAKIVYANYADAYNDAKKLREKISALLARPGDESLAEAKQAWLASRDSYGTTEAFRFYEGPIDKEGGPEARLNSWPVNEAYIDYVKGDVNAGIVQRNDVDITKKILSEKNQERDEADVATGYHAIEFLLWGQDLRLDSAGNRPASDYEDTAQNARRRDYVKIAAELLVDDLGSLTDAWEPKKGDYAKEFLAQDPKKSLGDMLTGVATLSGFELASERIATALDSGDQEDEHSCFSDNTHNDFIANVKGISNVYFGRYKEEKGASLHALLKETDEKLATHIENDLRKAQNLVDTLPHPVDREILAAPKESEGRKHAEELVATLQRLAEELVGAGKKLGVEVKIASD
ncbi:MAG: imelysin family protein [Rickettsiales bacterium]